MCTRDDRFGVLLVGETEPVAVRADNMRAISGTPVYRDRPQEQEAGNVHGMANMAVLNPKDVAMEGESYESSAGSVMPRAGEAASAEAAPTDGQADWDVPMRQSQSQELERRCTCCQWCTGIWCSGELVRRCTCTDRAVPFCLKCEVSISEAAVADVHQWTAPVAHRPMLRPRKVRKHCGGLRPACYLAV